MSDPFVKVTRDGGVSVLHMDDGKANALSPQMITELSAALDEAEKLGDAVVLAGREGRFSAGFDLKVMMTSVEAAKTLVRSGGELLLRLYMFPRPVVIACTGHALAGGALLVLIGDHRVAARGPFRIGLNEVSIGMPLPILGQELARDRLTSAELPRATLFAHIYDPETALAAGYLDATAAPDELLSIAKAEAARLGALSTSAYAATKQRLRERTVQYIRDTLDRDMAQLAPPTG